MSDASSNREDIYPAIHDFSILPMGLAGALVWSIRHCTWALEAGKNSMDVYLCADDKGPLNLFQRHFLDQNNYQAHLLEVFPAFFCNPMLRKLYLYTDRQAYNAVLDRIARRGPCSETAVNYYKKLRSESHSRERVDNELIRFENYNTFCTFYSEKGYLPKLVPPKGCDRHAAAFRERIGNDKFIVTVQFRMGKISVTRIEDSDLRENFSFIGWYDFMKVVERKFPDVRFIMLGKVPDMPMMCLRLSNVIVPRVLGYNLAHELALLQISDLFMGSHSGFAPMAIFSNIPYILTNLKEEDAGWWTGHLGRERYPFAAENQRLVRESESAPMLLKYFGEVYAEWKKKGHSRPSAERHDEVRTNFLFYKADELKKKEVDLEHECT